MEIAKAGADLRLGRPTNARLAEEVAQDLRNQIREALKNAVDETGTDDVLLEVLNSRFFVISLSERPSENHLLDSTVQYMNITNQMMARDAVIALAEANWDIEYAVARYFDGRLASPMPTVESRISKGYKWDCRLHRFKDGSSFGQVEKPNPPVCDSHGSTSNYCCD